MMRPTGNGSASSLRVASEKGTAARHAMWCGGGGDDDRRAAQMEGRKEGRKEGREERKGVSSRQLINECAVKKPFLAGSATAAAVGSRRQGNLSSANGVV